MIRGNGQKLHMTSGKFLVQYILAIVPNPTYMGNFVRAKQVSCSILPSLNAILPDLFLYPIHSFCFVSLI